MNEYERQRTERIQRNQEHMRRLGLAQAATDFAATTATAANGGGGSASARKTRKRRSKRARSADLSDNDGDLASRRRSRRLQGGAAERADGLSAVEDLMALGGAAAALGRRRQLERAAAAGGGRAPRAPAPCGGGPPDDYDGHNAYRLSYMSEAQLWRRVEQISNPAKLRSFAQALESAGERAMARRARERLGDPEGEDDAGEEDAGEEEEDAHKENKEEGGGADAEARLAARRVSELGPGQLARLAGRVRDVGELKALIEALEEGGAGSNSALDGARERAWARLEALQKGEGGGSGRGGGGRGRGGGGVVDKGGASNTFA